MQRPKIAEGIFFAILSSIFSSVGIVIASAGTKALTPLLFLSAAGFIGSAILLVYSYMRKGIASFKAIKKNSRDLLTVTVFRALIGQSFLMVGLSLTTGIVAIFFTKMEPYFVLLWNWILGREPIDKKHLILLCVHLFGAFLLATGGMLSLSGGELGDLLIIIAVAILALTYLSGKRLSNGIGAINSNIITYGIASIVILPVSLFVIHYQGAAIQQVGWAYVVLEAVLFNVLALTLWFASLKTVKGWIVSALRATGPLVAAPFALIFFGQTLSLVQVAGGLVVLATSYLISREHKK